MHKHYSEVLRRRRTATIWAMNQEVVKLLSDQLAPEGCMDRSEAEAGYPARKVGAEALVTRLAPSPTGFVHIGTIYMALINRLLASQSGGLFYLRIEDTDKTREVEGSQAMIENALNYFGIVCDEGPQAGGLYGPYLQSQRQPLYMSYALWLLNNGRAYPCFATKEELDGIHQKQSEQKVRPGYYGDYALWRNKSEAEIKQALDQKRPFVLRFKSAGSHLKRLEFNDQLKGRLELPENDLDVPLLKSDGLPTYHLAHIVDDFLMGTTLVVRGDEWLSSLPLHIELGQALNIKAFNYAHVAPISIMDGQSKRKLSKRKDESANVKYWIDAGYPPGAVIEYLMGLASSDFENWRQQNPTAKYQDFILDIKKLAMSRGPLLDEMKLADSSRDYIAKMSQEDFTSQLQGWVSAHDYELSEAMNQDKTYTAKVLTIERESANRRKDLTRWSDAREMYGYFFDSLFEKLASDSIGKELAEVPQLEQTTASLAFLEAYHPSDDQPTWLEKMRRAAQTAGYAPDSQSYKNDASKYKGQLADFAKIIRVKLTSKNRSPDLYSVMQIMGQDRVRRRLHS